MAAYVGARVTFVSIDPDKDDGPARFGSTRVEWPLDRFSRRELHEKSVLVSLAGPVAEMIYTGDPFHPGTVAEWSEDWREAWKWAEDLVADSRQRLVRLEQATRGLHQLFNDDRHWDALAGIADHLLAHETLEQDMIEDVLSNWFD